MGILFWLFFSNDTLCTCTMYIREAQKNSKFCDSGQMMGEVLINNFTFTIFDFINPTLQQSTKTKTKK